MKKGEGEKYGERLADTQETDRLMVRKDRNKMGSDFK